MTTVIHDRQRQSSELAGTYVYIGRPSKWGNPFRLGVDGTRDEVIQKFREYWYADAQTQLRADALRELPGTVLGCFCHPLPCHGHVIAGFVNTAHASQLPPSPLL